MEILTNFFDKLEKFLHNLFVLLMRKRSILFVISAYFT